MQASLRERIRQELEALLKEGKELVATLANQNDAIAFGRTYQRWYTRALRVVATLAPDRLKEFVGYYEVDPKRKAVGVTTYRIQDFVNGLAPTKHPYTGELPFNHQVATFAAFNSQVIILEAVESRLEDVLSDVEGRIAAELQDAGLASARQLLDVSPRAAGALAGVVLEDHLQRVATARAVKITKKDPSIGDLNDPLKAAGVYDQPTWRRIQFLADVRNLCSHKKQDAPSPGQVRELLDGAARVIANVS